MIKLILNTKINFYFSKIITIENSVNLFIIPSLELYCFKKEIIKNKNKIYIINPSFGIRLQWLIWEFRVKFLNIK